LDVETIDRGSVIFRSSGEDAASSAAEENKSKSASFIPDFVLVYTGSATRALVGRAVANGSSLIVAGSPVSDPCSGLVEDGCEVA
jgi:hypothetical protein